MYCFMYCFSVLGFITITNADFSPVAVLISSLTLQSVREANYIFLENRLTIFRCFSGHDIRLIASDEQTNHIFVNHETASLLLFRLIFYVFHPSSMIDCITPMSYSLNAVTKANQVYVFCCFFVVVVVS